MGIRVDSFVLGFILEICYTYWSKMFGCSRVKITVLIFDIDSRGCLFTQLCVWGESKSYDPVKPRCGYRLVSDFVNNSTNTKSCLNCDNISYFKSIRWCLVTFRSFDLF